MKRRLFGAAIFLAASVSLSVPALAAQRAVLPEDLYRLKFVGSPALSPNGAYAAVVVQSINGPKDTYETTIEVVDTATGVMRTVPGGGHDSGPAWSPDSTRLAFTRGGEKGKRPQLFLYRVQTGRAAALTVVKDGASGAVWSHDGKRLAFTVVARDPVHDAYADFRAAGFTPKKSQRKTDIHIVRDMHFEANGSGYNFDRHAHIWTGDATGSNARALTSGVWSEGNPQWSADDRTIAFESLRRTSPSLGPSDIYTIASHGGAMRRVPSDQTSNSMLGIDHHDRLWSTRGGTADPAEYPAIVVSALSGAAPRTVVEKNAVSLGDIVLADMGEPGGLCGPYFSRDDRFAIFNVSAPGYTKLVKFDTSTGKMTDLTPATGTVSECSMDASGTHVAYTFGDFTHLRELFLLDLETGKSRRISGFNDAYMRSVRLSAPQPFAVKNSDGMTVQAWFMPASNGKGGKHATILDIHGGPETEFGNAFFHEFQVLASQGYNVVFSDPRGSVGFGYPFEEALAKHWGDAMFDDVEAVMNEAVKRPGVDVNRLGVSGGSYGGYATLWVISHTHRYKAAVAERVVSNLATEQLAADLASDNALGGRYSWGLPWEKDNQYLATSPISYVQNVTTPLLILHSSEDTRTPIDQTLQEFNALKILGRTAEYVDVPGENHDLSRTGNPLHRVERLHIISQWLGHWLKP